MRFAALGAAATCVPATSWPTWQARKMDKYVRGKVLGKGSFGCAILVTSKVDGKNYVIKEVDISRMPKTEREAAEQEAKVWSAACTQQCTMLRSPLMGRASF